MRTRSVQSKDRRLVDKEQLGTPVVTKALQNAIQSRRPDTPQLLHHSDRGCQYTSDEYRGMLKKLGITVSMSHVGYCYDNAVMERFLWSLRHEWTNHHHHADIEDARASSNTSKLFTTPSVSTRLWTTSHPVSSKKTTTKL